MISGNILQILAIWITANDVFKYKQCGKIGTLEHVTRHKIHCDDFEMTLWSELGVQTNITKNERKHKALPKVKNKWIIHLYFGIKQTNLWPCGFHFAHPKRASMVFTQNKHHILLELKNSTLLQKQHLDGLHSIGNWHCQNAAKQVVYFSPQQVFKYTGKKSRKEKIIVIW